jgi:23S rRNA (adenine2503-C2)-methyltransferase
LLAHTETVRITGERIQDVQGYAAFPIYSGLIMTGQIVLLDLDYHQLADLLAGWGEPPYRANQVWLWLYRRLAGSVDVMTDLPKSLRNRLSAESILDPLEAVEAQESGDGATRKTLFRLRDNLAIEAVLMGYRKRHTVCVSTQVGCALGCPFCATGQSGFARNLTIGEIVAQVLHFGRQLMAGGDRVTNVVFMGMGEPLANYRATWTAITRLNDPTGFDLGARHMTISTVGLVPGIRRMAQERLQVGLAVSLHAANDALRDQLVPVNRRYPLARLLEACREYINATGRQITFEYALIAGVNDSSEQALELVGLVKGLLCHINLIPLNPTPGSPHRGSSRATALDFRATLLRQGIPATLRLRRGIDIEAGCGQLRRKVCILLEDSV